MRDIIRVYKLNRININNYLKGFLKSYDSSTYLKSKKSPLGDAPFIQLVYSLDEYFKQTSSVVCRKEEVEDGLGKDKSHHFYKIVLDEDGFYIANPYVHYRTGQASLSIVRKVKDKYYIFDIDMMKLLEEMKLLEYNSIHDKFKRGIYTIGASLLALVSLILIVYGGYELRVLFNEVDTPEFFNSIFTSIISITLGIAIFDLAKQIFEHEVLFHSFSHDDDKQYKVLGKFLVSIVIALSIETLMVVFKLALTNYTYMLNAFYLLIGTTLMFVGLAYFYKTIGIGNKKQ